MLKIRKIVLFVVLVFITISSLFMVRNKQIVVAAGCEVRLNNVLYPSIQEAIDVAPEGSLIQVAGTCSGVVVRNGLTQIAYISKTLTIQGGYNASDWSMTPDPTTYPTILDAQSLGRVIVITGTGITPKVDGLIIKGGNSKLGGVDNWGGGIKVVNAQATLVNLIVSDNLSKNGGGAGISLSYADKTQILTSTIKNNFSQLERGGGIYIVSTKQLLVHNVNILNNRSDHQGAGLYMIDTASISPTFRNVLFRGNESGRDNGAAWIRGDGAILENVTFDNNKSLENLTVEIDGDNVHMSYITVTNNMANLNTYFYFAGGYSVLDHFFVANNTSNGSGFRLKSFNRSTLKESVIMDNLATQFGGGLHVESGNDYIIDNNIIVHNQVTVGGKGSGLYLQGLRGLIYHNTIVSNTGGDGSAIFVNGTGFAIKNNIIVSHVNGIYAPDTIYNIQVDRNIVWDITNLPFAQVSLGLNNRTDCDPLFVDSAIRDYHLKDGSCAVDYGQSVNVLNDIEGNVRKYPLSYGFDVGAYESVFSGVLSASLNCPPQIVGKGEDVVLTATVTLPDMVVNYAWSSDGLKPPGSTAQQAVFNWNTIGTKTVAVTVTDTINPPIVSKCTVVVGAIEPVTVVALTGKIQGFVNRPYTVTATSNTTATQPIIYKWQPEPLSGQGTDVATYKWAEAGDKQIYATANNGSQPKTGSFTTEIFLEPDPGFNIDPDTASGRAPSVFTFTNPSNYPTEDGWDFGDGTPFVVKNPVTHTYPNVGVYTLTHVVTKFLPLSSETSSYSLTKVITVHTPVEASFTLTPTIGTRPISMSVEFCNDSKGDYDVLTWLFGDGTTEVTTTVTTGLCFQHRYQIPKNLNEYYFTTTLRASGPGGVSDYTRVVTVYRTLVASFTTQFIPGTYKTVPQKVCFTNNSSGQNTHAWDFGNGASSGDINPLCQNYTTKGTYTVVLTVTGANKQVKTLPQTFTLHDPVQAVVQCDTNFPVVNEPFNCSDLSTGDIVKREWSWGDGTFFDTPPIGHTYLTTGTYAFTFTVNGQGGDKSSQNFTMTVLDKIKAQFEAIPTSGTIPLTVKFNNKSSGNYTKLVWDFGYSKCAMVTQVSPFTDPVCTYKDVGCYTAVLTASGYGRSYSTTKQICAYDSILAKFTPSVQSGILSTNNTSFVVTFTNQTFGNYDTLIWNFGDGTILTSTTKANSYSYTYTQAGYYSVTLTAKGLGGSDTTDPITIAIYNQCVAQFKVSPVEGAAPLTTVFTNESVGDCDHVSWVFGNGEKSDQFQPISQVYDLPGYYTPTLTMSGFGGTSTFTSTPPLKVWGLSCDFTNNNLTLTQDNNGNLVLTYPPMEERQQLRSAGGCYPRVQWYADNLPQGIDLGEIITSEHRAVISKELLAPPSIWRAEVRACNANGCSSPLLTQNISIGGPSNHLPIITASIVPSLPWGIESLQLSSTTFDEDNDNITFSSRWYKVSEARYYQVLEDPKQWNFGIPYAKDVDNIKASNTETGTIWCVELDPYDSKEWGSTAKDCVIIGEDNNRPPLAQNPQVFIIRSEDVISDLLKVTMVLTYNYYDDLSTESDNTRIRWYRNGVYQQNLANKRIVVDENALANDFWFAIVQPHDGRLFGLPVKSNHVIIKTLDQNTPPVAKDPKITPFKVAKDHDNLKLGYIYDDAEFDLETGSLIYWYETSIDPSLANRIRKLDGLRTLPKEQTHPGQVWYAKIIPSDGHDFGEAVDADTVRIEAAPPPPQLFDIRILPQQPGPDDDLVLDYKYDLDAGIPIITTTWTRDGIEESGLRDAGTVLKKATEPNEKWCVKVTPLGRDGQKGMIYGPICVTIAQPANTPPRFKDNRPPYIEPARPLPNELVLTVHYDYYDGDNDLEGQTRIKWYKEGQYQPEMDNQERIRATGTRQGQPWYAQVELHDGKEYGAISATEVVTVNTTPIIVDPNMPTVVRASESITLSYGKCVDPDGDPCSIRVRWYLTPTDVITLEQQGSSLALPIENNCSISGMTLLSNYNDELVLPAGITQEGQQLALCFWPYDEYISGPIQVFTRTIQRSLVIPEKRKLYLPLLVKMPLPTPTPTPEGSPTMPPTPAMTVVPSSLNFGGPHLVNTPIAPKNITITNAGTANLLVTPWPTQVGEFELTTCSTIEPQRNCVITATYKPITKGPKQENVTINSNAPAGPQTLTLLGQAKPNPCTPEEFYEDNDKTRFACEIKLNEVVRAYPDDEDDYYSFTLTDTVIIRTIRVNNYAAPYGGSFWVYTFDQNGQRNKLYSNNLHRNQSWGNPFANRRNPQGKLWPGTYYIWISTPTTTTQELYELELSR